MISVNYRQLAGIAMALHRKRSLQPPTTGIMSAAIISNSSIDEIKHRD